MNWEELKNGQRVKALDKIFYVEDGSIVNNDERDIYITETQITSGRGLTPVANKGDIGVWSSADGLLTFTSLNSDGKEITNSMDFQNGYEFPDIDNEIFEVLNEFGELGLEHG